MKGATPSDDMWELTARAVAGDITNDQFQRLIQLLEESKDARRQYVQAMRLQAELSWSQSLGACDDRLLASELLHDSAPDSDGMSTEEATLPLSRSFRQEFARSARSKFAHGMWFAAGAAILFVGVLIGMLVPRKIGEVPDRADFAMHRAEEDVPATAVQVGELSASTSCSWLGSRGITPNIGRKIISGKEFALLQGVAKLELRDGVTLQIDGPTALVIASESSIVLQYGTLTGKVEPGSSLEVAIPSGRLAIGEGEFGVRVAGEQSQVHCFAGSIAVTLNPFGTLSTEREFFGANVAAGGADVLHVEEGSAVRVIAANGVLKLDRQFTADRNSFATTLPMEGPLNIPAAYVAAVTASRPVGYWRFNPSAEHTVQNELADKYALRSKGHVRFGGDALNAYVEFGAENTNGYLVSGEPVDELFNAESYTLELWLKPSHYHPGMTAGLIDNPDTSPHGGVVIELLPGSYEPGPRSGRVRFLHRSPPSHLVNIGKSIYSANPYALRRWQHLAAVKDGAELRLYLDGKLVANGEEETRLAGELHIMCGQLPLLDGGRQYIGQLDEMALYDRPLGEQEILAHFRAAPQEHAEDSVASLAFQFRSISR